MQMDINLDLNVKQDLVMTPKLQMAVKILQYSSQELEEFINEQTKENKNYENFIAYHPQFCESIENHLFEVLSDAKIAEIFENEYGLKISRRTLAKYRKSIAIVGSRARKK